MRSSGMGGRTEGGSGEGVVVGWVGRGVISCGEVRSDSYQLEGPVLRDSRTSVLEIQFSLGRNRFVRIEQRPRIVVQVKERRVLVVMVLHCRWKRHLRRLSQLKALHLAPHRLRCFAVDRWETDPALSLLGQILLFAWRPAGFHLEVQG